MKLSRILRIAYRMLYKDEEFYSTQSPRMSNSEYLELSSLGFWIQCEYPHPPESKFYYMMDEFELSNCTLFDKLVKNK